MLREAVNGDSGVLTEQALGTVDLAGRMRFLGQAEVLRGGRKANEIVKEFWVACRGSAFGYTCGIHSTDHAKSILQHFRLSFACLLDLPPCAQCPLSTSRAC
jgi:hypothetical protein